MSDGETGPGGANKALLFDRVGGEDGVRAVVERFYDLMEHEPDYAELRAMHDADLLPCVSR